MLWCENRKAAAGLLVTDPVKVFKEKITALLVRDSLGSDARIVSRARCNGSQHSTRAKKIRHLKQLKTPSTLAKSGKIRGPGYQILRNRTSLDVLTPTVHTARFPNPVLGEKRAAHATVELASCPGTLPVSGLSFVLPQSACTSPVHSPVMRTLLSVLGVLQET